MEVGAQHGTGCDGAARGFGQGLHPAGQPVDVQAHRQVDLRLHRVPVQSARALTLAGSTLDDSRGLQMSAAVAGGAQHSAQ